MNCSYSVGGTFRINHNYNGFFLSLSHAILAPCMDWPRRVFHFRVNKKFVTQLLLLLKCQAVICAIFFHPMTDFCDAKDHRSEVEKCTTSTAKWQLFSQIASSLSHTFAKNIYLFFPSLFKIFRQMARIKIRLNTLLCKKKREVFSSVYAILWITWSRNWSTKGKIAN